MVIYTPSYYLGRDDNNAIAVKPCNTFKDNTKFREALITDDTVHLINWRESKATYRNPLLIMRTDTARNIPSFHLRIQIA